MLLLGPGRVAVTTEVQVATRPAPQGLHVKKWGEVCRKRAAKLLGKVSVAMTGMQRALAQAHVPFLGAPVTR